MNKVRGRILRYLVCAAVSTLAVVLVVWPGPWLIRLALAVGIGALPLLLRTGQTENKQEPPPDPVVLLETPEEVEARAENEMRREISPRLSTLVEELRNQVSLLLGEVRERHPGAGIQTFFKEYRDSALFINENVLRAYEISDNLANTAKQAFELSEHVQTGVKIVTDSLNESLKYTELLFGHSKKISRILTIMSDISEKIHVLSINASIVSARAGQSGKGFEVVAKEIRNLARETENSLSDIENVITEVQATIQNVIEKVEIAHKETETEKGSLLSVAGSLQGVILAVEIIRAVSSVAKERGETQTDQINRTLDEGPGGDADLLVDVTETVTGIGQRVEDLALLLQTDREE